MFKIKTFFKVGVCLFPCAGLLLFQVSIAAESAPGRGVIPMISNHYKTQPSLYDFHKMPGRQITPSVKRRFILGTESSLTQWTLKSYCLKCHIA